MTDVVSKELNVPVRCLGCRALNRNLRNEHNIKVPRHLVHNVLVESDGRRRRTNRLLECSGESAFGKIIQLVMGRDW